MEENLRSEDTVNNTLGNANTVAGTDPVSVAMPQIQKSKPKKKLLFLLLGLGLVLGGGSAGAYYGVMLPNKPENVLKQMTANLFDKTKITSTRFNGELSMTQKDGENAPVPVTISFDGSTKDNKLEFNAVVDAVIAKPKLSLLVVDTKDLFFRVSGINGLDALLGSSEETSAYSPIIKKINNQWYEVSSNILKSIPGMEASSLDTSTLALSSDDLKKIAEVYEKNQFIKNIEKLDDEKINEKNNHHLKVVFDKDKVLGFVDGVKGLKLKALESVKDSDFDEIKKMVSKYDWTKYPIEIWADKATKNLTQIKYVQDYKSGKVDFKFTLKDVNSSDIKIDKPTDAKSILELVGDASTLLEQSGLDLNGFNGIDSSQLETILQ